MRRNNSSSANSRNGGSKSREGSSSRSSMHNAGNSGGRMPPGQNANWGEGQNQQAPLKQGQYGHPMMTNQAMPQMMMVDPSMHGGGGGAGGTGVRGNINLNHNQNYSPSSLHRGVNSSSSSLRHRGSGSRLSSGHASVNSMQVGGGQRMMSNQDIHKGSGGNASWGNIQQQQIPQMRNNNNMMRSGHASMSAMQGMRTMNVGGGGGGGAGTNASWGNMQPRGSNGMLKSSNNSRAGKSSGLRKGMGSLGNMLRRPSNQEKQQGQNTNWDISPHMTPSGSKSSRNSLLGGKRNTSAFSFGVRGGRATQEKNPNEVWDMTLAENGEGGRIDQIQGDGNINSSGDNPMLVAMAEKNFLQGWDQYMGDNNKPLDKVRGEELIVKAMREGSMTARGFCLANGWGIKKDHKMAFSIFKSLAVHKGDSYGMALKAHCFLNGNGVQRDKDEAIYWLSMAVELKNGWATGLMGSCFQDGEGVERNERRALELYKDAAEIGYVKAMYQLGWMYEAGISSGLDGMNNLQPRIPPSSEEGLKWFRMAANKNHTESKRLVKEMTKIDISRDALTAAQKEITGLGMKAERMELKLLEELVTGMCCKLDGVETYGNEKLRAHRKQLIRTVEAIASIRKETETKKEDDAYEEALAAAAAEAGF
mmetsp:Transcript_3737/g.4326  ORF Transcript_3737/g.4326 Transcript_3737/m.4326 type:complete len:647 (+) Transcript_3737:174-2114(+)